MRSRSFIRRWAGASLLLSMVCFVTACSSTSTVTVQGTLVDYFPTNPTQASFVSVVGRDDLKLTVTSKNWNLQVPGGERLVFKVVAGGKNTYSFPILPQGGVLTDLGFLTSTDYNGLIEVVVNQTAGTENPVDPSDTTKGIILGTVSSGNRSKISSIKLLDQTTGLNASSIGPFFFKTPDTGEEIPAIGLELVGQDHEQANTAFLANGKYAFFSVAEGNYTMTFQDATGTPFSGTDISVVAGEVVIGQDIP